MHATELKRWLKYIAGISLVGFMAYYLFAQMSGHWHDLLLSFRRFEPLTLLLSVQLLLIYHVVLAFLFRRWIGFFGGDLSWVKTFKVIYVSQMARFLPGGIWGYVGQVYMGGREGIGKGKVLLASAGHTGLNLITGGFLALLIFPKARFGLGWEIFPLFLLGAVTVVLLFPRGIRLLNGRLSGEGKGGAPRPPLERGPLISLSLLYSVHWLLYGVAFWFFLFSLGFSGQVTFAGALGPLALSGILGLIIPFVPGGLGVREGALAFLLQPQLGGAEAALVAVLSRVWLIGVDLICFGLALCLEPGIFLLKKRLG